MSVRRPLSTRRWSLLTASFGTIVALSGTAGAPILAASPNPSSPWSQTDSNGALSRANLSERTLKPGVVARAVELRTLKTPPLAPAGTCANILPPTSPLLDNGRVYDAANGRLSMYDARTGKLEWRTVPAPAFDALLDTMTVTKNLIIVSGVDCDTADTDGRLFAFNATTGHREWTLHTDAPGEEMVQSGPYLIVNGPNPGSGQTDVYKMGSPSSPPTYLWDEIPDCDSFLPVVVVHDVVVTQTCGGFDAPTELEGHNLATGALEWALAGFWDVQRGSNAGADGHLYGGAQDINPITGVVRFSLTGATSVLAVDSHRAYAQCGEYVCGYDEASGDLLWTSKQPDGMSADAALGAEAGGVLYLATGAAYNAANGKLIRQLWHDDASAIAIGDGRIAAVNGSGSAPALRLWGPHGS